MKSIGGILRVKTTSSNTRKRSNNRESSRSSRKASARKISARKVIKMRSSSSRQWKKDTSQPKKKDTFWKISNGSLHKPNGRESVKKAHSSRNQVSKESGLHVKTVGTSSPCFPSQWNFHKYSSVNFMNRALKTIRKESIRPAKKLQPQRIQIQQSDENVDNSP